MRHRKILIMGLPGSGKTTLATLLALRIKAVHFNADEVRRNVNKDLGYTPEDRVEQALRMGWLCDQVVKPGHIAIADFVCPTALARRAFMLAGPASVIWINRIEASRFPDTNKLFEPPTEFKDPDEFLIVTGSLRPEAVVDLLLKKGLNQW